MKKANRTAVHRRCYAASSVTRFRSLRMALKCVRGATAMQPIILTDHNGLMQSERDGYAHCAMRGIGCVRGQFLDATSAEKHYCSESEWRRIFAVENAMTNGFRSSRHNAWIHGAATLTD